FLGDVPAAIVAGGGLVVAAVAVERAALEELLQAFSIFGAEVAGIAWQRQRIAAAVALTRVEPPQPASVMIVNAARHRAPGVEQWTRHTELGRDRLADKRALIGQLVEQISQLCFDLERHHGGFRRLARHEKSSKGKARDFPDSTGGRERSQA